MLDTIDVVVMNLLTGTVLNFFCIPETLSDSISANFDPITIRGRSSQYHGYEASGPRTTSLSVRAHEDYLYGGNNILEFVNKVRALAYPEYSGYVIPPRCYVKIGNTLAGLCVVGNVDVSWSPPIRNNRYILADFTIALTVLEPLAPSASEVESGSQGTGRRQSPGLNLNDLKSDESMIYSGDSDSSLETYLDYGRTQGIPTFQDYLDYGRTQEPVTNSVSVLGSSRGELRRR